MERHVLVFLSDKTMIHPVSPLLAPGGPVDQLTGDLVVDRRHPHTVVGHLVCEEFWH